MAETPIQPMKKNLPNLPSRSPVNILILSANFLTGLKMMKSSFLELFVIYMGKKERTIYGWHHMTKCMTTLISAAKP